MNEEEKQSIIEICEQYTIPRSLGMHAVRREVSFPVTA
jgi:hypothetical protein